MSDKKSGFRIEKKNTHTHFIVKPTKSSLRSKTMNYYIKSGRIFLLFSTRTDPPTSEEKKKKNKNVMVRGSQFLVYFTIIYNNSVIVII